MSKSGRAQKVVKFLIPVAILRHVIIAADRGYFTPLYDFVNSTSSRSGFFFWTVRIKLQRFPLEEDVIAEEQDILEDIDGEARGMTPYMEGFNTFRSEVLFEELIEGEGAGNTMNRVFFM